MSLDVQALAINGTNSSLPLLALGANDASFSAGFDFVRPSQFALLGEGVLNAARRSRHGRGRGRAKVVCHIAKKLSVRLYGKGVTGTVGVYDRPHHLIRFVSRAHACRARSAWCDRVSS